MWAVRVTADHRTGTGAVIAPTLVLTCQHVVKNAGRIRVRTGAGEPDFSVLDADDKLDVALLEPVETGFELDPESILIPRVLGRGRRPGRGETFVELCTQDPETPRSLEIALQPTPLDSARVQFVVTGSREGVRHSYSGGPVVEIHGRARTPRLLGIVRARDETSVDAFDNAGVGWFVPVERIARRFPAAAALVESPAERDPAWLQHWQPRSRGVATSRDEGFFFSGRVVAHERVVRHLEDGEGLLIVTGTRGCGKSAVLAHAVALGFPRYATWIGEQPGSAKAGYQSPTRPVDAAVLARGKTSEAVAAEIADQLGLEASGPEDLVADLTGEACSIAIDAVDEARDPDDLMNTVVGPLVGAGMRLAVGALRRRIGAVQVPPQTEWLDLTADAYRDPVAIPVYVASRLRDEAGYDASAAELVAGAVSERASGLFLVAELAARVLARRAPIDPDVPGWEMQLPADLTEAFQSYLGGFGDASSRVLALLHPLAHARGEGLRAQGDLWLAAANRLRPRALDPFGVSDLTDACRRAQDYLVGGNRGEPVKLYHQGLAGAIRTLAATDELNQADEHVTPEAVEHELNVAANAFVDALAEQLPDADAPADAYADSDAYLLQHLASHLADLGRVGELLDRPGLLLTADQRELQRAFVPEAATLPADHDNARVAIAHALNRRVCPGPGDRAAALCAALRRQGANELAERVRRAFVTAWGGAQLPYELIGGPPLPDSPYYGIMELDVAEDGGRQLVVSGGAAGAIQSWWLDGEPGPLNDADAHSGFVGALKVVAEGGCVVSTGRGAIRSWRLDGEPGTLNRADAHGGKQIDSLLVVEKGGQPLVVSGGGDGAIRSWWLDGAPGPLNRPDAHSGWIRALLVVDEGGRPLVVSGGADGAIRSWRLDSAPGPLNRPDAHSDRIGALLDVDDGGRPLVVSGSDRAIRSWRLDGAPGPLDQARADRYPASLRALKVVDDRVRPFVVSGDLYGEIRSWWLDGEPGPLNQPRAHGPSIGALAVVEQRGRRLVLSGGGDDGVLLAHSVAPVTRRPL
jgi:hypothetical protein